MTVTELIIALRRNYLEIKNALPWLDAWVDPGGAPAAALAKTAVQPPAGAAPVAVSDAAEYPDHTLVLAAGGMAGVRRRLFELENRHCPVLFKATEVTPGELDELAAAHPRLRIVIATGDRKILYQFADFRELMLRRDNVYLVTANLCNWFGLERLVAAGLGERLFYGSFMPLGDAAASMGPLILSSLEWPVKCGIAGNNLRRLLGRTPSVPAPAVFHPPVRPFIIDAHTHCALSQEALPMETPIYRNYREWRQFMDGIGIDKLLMTPCETIHSPELSAEAAGGRLCRASRGRIRLFEVYDPRDPEASAAHLRAALGKPEYIGIKLHPALHRTYADDDRYRAAFELARRFGKPVMSHTWAISSYNPSQKYSCPELFERWLREFPEVRMIFGHAGGRPESFAAVIRLLNQYPRTAVDIAGDYFYNGVISALLQDAGADQILFASDVDWIDPRCQLGQLLDSPATPDELRAILRDNAERIFQL